MRAFPAIAVLLGVSFFACEERKSPEDASALPPAGPAEQGEPTSSRGLIPIALFSAASKDPLLTVGVLVRPQALSKKSDLLVCFPSPESAKVISAYAWVDGDPKPSWIPCALFATEGEQKIRVGKISEQADLTALSLKAAGTLPKSVDSFVVAEWSDGAWMPIHQGRLSVHRN